MAEVAATRGASLWPRLQLARSALLVSVVLWWGAAWTSWLTLDRPPGLPDWPFLKGMPIGALRPAMLQLHLNAPCGTERPPARAWTHPEPSQSARAPHPSCEGTRRLRATAPAQGGPCGAPP